MRRSHVAHRSIYAHLVRIVNGLITHDYATQSCMCARARARNFLHNVISRSYIPGALRNNIRSMGVGTLKRPI